MISLGSRISAFISLPITLAGIVLAYPLITFWMGSDFTDDGYLVQLFLSYVIFAPMAVYSYNIIIGAGKMRGLLIMQISGLIINLSVSLVLVFTIGIEGVILGTVISTMATMIPTIMLAHRITGGSTLGFLTNVAIRAYSVPVLLALVLWYVSDTWPPTSLVSVGAYGLSYIGVSYVVNTRVALYQDERAELAASIKGRLPRFSSGGRSAAG